MNEATDDLKTETPKSDGGYQLGQSSSDLVGFWGTDPVDQPASLTEQLTDITHTAPGSDDFTIQDLTDSGGFGFVTKDEGNTVLKVIANLQARVAELEDRLEECGLIAEN